MFEQIDAKQACFSLPIRNIDYFYEKIYMKYIVSVLVLSLLLPTFVICSNNVQDSLLRTLHEEQPDTAKVNTLNQLCLTFIKTDLDTALAFANKSANLAENHKYTSGIARSYFLSGVIFAKKWNYDTALVFLQKADSLFEQVGDLKEMAKTKVEIGKVYDYMAEFPKALKSYQDAMEISKSIKDSVLIAEVYLFIAFIHEAQGELDKTLSDYEKSLDIYKKINNLQGISRCYNNIGIYYQYKGNRLKALEYYQKALKISEENNYDGRVAYLYNNIGIIHEGLNDTTKALHYYKKALNMHKKFGYKEGIYRAYCNIGDIYNTIENCKKAQVFYKKALDIAIAMNSKYELSFVYSIIAKGYENCKKYDKAEEYYVKSLEIANKIGDSTGIAWAKTGLSKINFIKNNYDLALKFAESALNIAQKVREKSLLKRIYATLYKVYAKNARYKDAFETHLKYKNISDSLLNEEKIRNATRLEYQYQYEKEKQQQKLKQKQKELEHQQALAKQKTIRNTFVIGFVFIAILLILIFKNLQRKKKNNRILRMQKEEIEHKNAELSQMNHEITIQNQEISHINRHITSSINYAKKIQTALFPSAKMMEELFPHSFIFYQPLEIVSGDFYWIRKINHYKIVVTADCTGHGVSGAFMSLLGIAFLNEIARKRNLTKASEILDNLREEINFALGQKGEETTTNDGIDLALCIIDEKTGHAQFAGAYNPMYHFKNGQLTEFKGDRKPISVTEDKEPYTNQEFKIEKNDTLYFFTDGFPDQFGGKHGRKFMMKNFRKLLIDIHNLPMAEQKDILEKELNTWQNNYPQVDDILVVGIRI